MKFLIVLALAITTVLAAPQKGAPATADVQLLKSDFSNDPQTGYNFAFEQTDGQRRDENGEVRNAGAENEFVAVRGSFSFTAPDGQTYTVNYIADENGFQPTAEHIPTV